MHVVKYVDHCLVFVSVIDVLEQEAKKSSSGQGIQLFPFVVLLIYAML